MTIAGFLILGLTAGSIAAMLGIGGGVIFVPALVVLFAFGQHTAQGTSLAVILPTAIVGTFVHWRHHRVNWPIALMIAGGGVVGGTLGSAAALSLDPVLLRRLFAGLLVVLAIRVLSS